MATLERVMQMKAEGLTESQIITALKQEGATPKDINEALSQSKIKSALNREPPMDESMENMKPSITEASQKPVQKDEEGYTDYSDQNYPQYDPNSVQQVQNQVQGPDGYYQTPGQDSGYYPEYQQPQAPTDIETINDIAEQIVEEKNAELKKQISSFKTFKDESKIDLEKINERLQKLENNYNELQMAIIRKIGEYGEDIKNISNEMRATQDSFSKVLNPLTDNIRELQRITTQGNIPKIPEDKTKLRPSSTESTSTTQDNEIQSEDQERKRPGKPKADFENYLR